MSRTVSNQTTAFRHPKPPQPSELKPAQYAMLHRLIGPSIKSGEKFLKDCHAALDGTFVRPPMDKDDLIDDALEKIFRGRLGQKCSFPKSQTELVLCVVKRAKTTLASARRTRRRRGPDPIPFDDALQVAESTGQPALCLESCQLALLDKLETAMLGRLAALSLEPETSESALTSELDLG